ncbi:MAG: DUF4942 domain-containing protein [Selenomonas ruminantium]|nr:DUF4942 domain-containing protein [Selenomonas ruminantium]
MVDLEQYYPTPPETAAKLISMIDRRYVSDGINILEPSAGTGELIEAWMKVKKRNYDGDYHDFNGHCIEINAKRAATLKGKGYKVVWDDFLTFNPIMRYTLVLMNPPFREGERHLLKALEVCEAGGQIACILNAETIRNPHTNAQKALAAKLEEQEECNIEYVTAAFSDAERKTDVEVALIHIKTKDTPEVCVTFENFKKQIFGRRQEEQASGALARYGEINAIIDRYQAEVRAGLALYNEIQNYRAVSLEGTADQYDKDAVFEIKINRVADEGRNDDRANIIRKVNYKYWKILLYSKELSSLMTSAIQHEYSRNLTTMADYEFNERNILAMKEDLTRNLIHNVEVAIMDVWDEFTHRYSWGEYSKNIHYYNGWKTNKAFACNKKVILPLNAFSTISNDFRPVYEASSKLSDIEKVMNYLDCGRTEDFKMYERLEQAQMTGENRGIDTKFFKVDLFRKGTCHLTFKDLDLLKKFNLYCGKKKNWLPDDYGRKPYSRLDDEERKIVDSFEGKASYEDTYRNQEFYLPQTSDLLMLTTGNAPEAGGYEQ